MEVINVKTYNKEYSIIKEEALNFLNNYVNISKFSKVVILTDENLIKNGWLKKLPFDFIQIPFGEINKSLETVVKIWKSMNDFGMDRKSLLVNLGGGVVCDLGGFCASTYMRGIEFLQIPTTLLSQVDASVGGKTGFDFNGAKNIIGTFAEPYKVIIDSSTLKTLPKREYVSGMAEVIKYGIIYDKEFFEYLESKNISDDYIIKKSCEIKADVVGKDFKETGIRKILNFGHTIGHAIESLSLKTDKPLLHGEAVAIGMLAEAYISKMSDNDLKRIKNILVSYNLPISYKGNLNEIYSMLFKDKKNIAGKIKFVLANEIGSCDFDIEIEEDIIKSAIKNILL
ncbi:MAG TPA: 3-dehydroquinate synthase [Rickettsiales bacterium]|nr:3-dehydroquinate synthase [Rickettsiales bacterium]